MMILILAGLAGIILGQSIFRNDNVKPHGKIFIFGLRRPLSVEINSHCVQFYADILSETWAYPELTSISVQFLHVSYQCGRSQNVEPILGY